MMKLYGIAVIGAVSLFILQGAGWKGSGIIKSAVFILISGAVAVTLSGVSDEVPSVLSGTEASEHAAIILRAVGIIFAAEISSETCRSLGADSCASAIDLACRAELFILILPVLKRLFSVSTALL